MYLLDTNILSYWMRGDHAVIERIRCHAPADLGFSAISMAEILYGIEKSPVRKAERQIRIRSIASLLRLYPFDEDAAREYAMIRTFLERKGQIISERDMQIAAIAAANRLTLVTHNIKEFARIPSLIVEDWAETDDAE